jgi:RNA polymerase sigma factor (sigma-70 family)
MEMWCQGPAEGPGEKHLTPPACKIMSESGRFGYSYSKMQPKSDAQLLRDYVERGQEFAFAELVQRHTNLVYSAALRQVDSPDTAAEIAQKVFVDLAGNASALASRIAAEASLAGWLCRCARNVSLNFRRDEFRRQTHERQAMEQLTSNPDTAPDWQHLLPVLDDAMSGLTELEYDCLVLRFFQNRDFRSVGEAMGVSDDTAQKRVARALEKLRELLSRRGIGSTAAILAAVISANAVQAAPVGLASTIAATALSCAVVTTSTAIAAAKTIALTTFQKALITGAFIAVAGAGIFAARQAVKSGEENQKLQRQLSPLAAQIQELQREHDDATNRLAWLKSEVAANQQNNLDLLKLRGEVAGLQQQTQEMGKLRAENQRLLAAWPDAVPPAPEAEARAQQQQLMIQKLSDAKQGVVSFLMFAADHQQQYPTNFEQVTTYSNPDFVNHIETNFDLVYSGSSTTITKPASTIVLMEKQAWQTVDGSWKKTYGFADGHAEIQTQPDGNFTDWESQRIIQPAPNQ